MDLRQRGRSERSFLDPPEQLGQRLAQFGLDQGADERKRRGWRLVEQVFQFIGDGAGQHVLAHRHDLA